MDKHTQQIVERLRRGASECLSDYHNELRAGGEPPYPQAAADTLTLCSEYEFFMTRCKAIVFTQIGPLDIS